MTNLTAVYVADLMGVMLSIVVLYENAWRFREQTVESKILLTLTYVLLIACIAESLSFTVDGMAGTFARIAGKATNSWLFFSGVLVGPLGIAMITSHIHCQISTIHKYFIRLMVVVGTLVLIFNLFVPVVFKIDSHNVYSRQSLYWLYIAIMYVFLTDGVICYLVSKRRGVVVRFFPVTEFLLPLLVGLVLQTVFYGVSTIWPCLTISMCGVCFSLQNENVFLDKLTSSYNRLFLDNLSNRNVKFRERKLTAMMMDMNGFKAINDQFGHIEGDMALRAVAEILREVVGDNGMVIRYAGDEFVVLLNTRDEAVVKEYISHIHEQLRIYSKKLNRGYTLSVSIGYSEFDLDEQTVEDIMNIVDQRMYEDKKAFYAKSENNRRE
ncbi:GGDEF domain-containing protein [Agathobacter ruminis]|uniref:GGDEF domain-containing protein n=1 Tax=Agathobacter ruminis TaxID=1712665 RepID=A0A2G3E0X1_9FIRM|nr:GGDEF domain-containing protein [Agathobacter ruminis]MDC7300766.1 GGDEF domain-containing protein [Agathobacter ruminis]PHU36871.1 hypothetical protein CSX02_11040 [Agathobacter ruminis]